MKTYFFIALYILTSLSLFAQIKQFDSEESKELYWKRRANIEFLNDYINSYIVKGLANKEEKEQYNKSLKPKIDHLLNINNVEEFNKKYKEFKTILSGAKQWGGANGVFTRLDKDIDSKKIDDFFNEYTKGQYKINGKPHINQGLVKQLKNDFNASKIIENKKDEKLDEVQDKSKAQDAKPDNVGSNSQQNSVTNQNKDNEYPRRVVSDANFSILPYLLVFILGLLLMYFLTLSKIKQATEDKYEYYKRKSDFGFKKDIFPFVAVVRYLNNERRDETLLRKKNNENVKDNKYVTLKEKYDKLLRDNNDLINDLKMPMKKLIILRKKLIFNLMII
ncbi:MAG: hypothetical protein GXO49_06890 [Chlorobi bacterium]|nr:hypothetical protein [Chlorobiota bacterium]